MICIGPDIARQLIAREPRCDEHHLIHLAVAIPVVNGEVGGSDGFQLLQGLSHRIVTVITAFTGIGVDADLKGTIDVELEV